MNVVWRGSFIESVIFINVAVTSVGNSSSYLGNFGKISRAWGLFTLD